MKNNKNNYDINTTKMVKKGYYVCLNRNAIQW